MEWAVPVKQCKRVGVVSNDTATFILLLHYIPYFQALELKELWQLYSTGRKHHNASSASSGISPWRLIGD